MQILKYLWAIILGIFYVIYAVSAISDIIACIRLKEEPATSTILFILGTFIFGFFASFIYWVVTL